MKVKSAGILNSTTTSYGDLTKTFLAGRCFQKSINSNSVLGPPLTNFIDTITDTAGGGSVTPNGVYLSPNGRLFIAVTPATGLMTVLLYEFDLTGQTAPIYRGRIQLAVPNSAATTHTIRQFEVYDGPNAGTVTGWKIVFSTVGTVLINGGSFLANNITKADFVFTSPPTIGLAISSSAKAVYMLQDPSNIGVNNNITAIQGAGLDRSGLMLYVNNNVLATTQFIKWDLNATLTYPTQTTTGATSIGSPTFTLASHGYNNNDPVVIISNPPGGFTATTATVQTVYFVRNATLNTFELSATSGGASINATTVTSGTVFGRAFGQITTPWTSTKTGTVTGITGTILLTQSHSLVTPSQALDPNIPSGLDGQLCFFLPCATMFHLFKVSDIVNGATNFPSMSAVNPNGTGTDYTAISVAQASYAASVGQVIYTSNTSAFYAKKWLSGSISHAFGGLNTSYWENTPSRQTTNFSAVALTTISSSSGQGWLCFGSTTAGQRGVFFMDFKSDSSFGYSYVVSPLIETARTQYFEFIQTIEELFDYTNSLELSFKTALTNTDPIFTDPTTGWTSIPNNESLRSFALSNYTQVRVDFAIAQLTAQTPAQIREVYLGLTAENDESEFWDYSDPDSSSSSPARAAFSQIKAYSGSKHWEFIAFVRDTGALYVQADTQNNPTDFELSTNDGTSYGALAGAIPSSPLQNVLRYKFSSPPGVKLRVSLREKA